VQQRGLCKKGTFVKEFKYLYWADVVERIKQAENDLGNAGHHK